MVLLVKVCSASHKGRRSSAGVAVGWGGWGWAVKGSLQGEVVLLKDRAGW